MTTATKLEQLTPEVIDAVEALANGSAKRQTERRRRSQGSQARASRGGEGREKKAAEAYEATNKPKAGEGRRPKLDPSKMSVEQGRVFRRAMCAALMAMDFAALAKSHPGLEGVDPAVLRAKAQRQVAYISPGTSSTEPARGGRSTRRWDF